MALLIIVSPAASMLDFSLLRGLDDLPTFLGCDARLARRLLRAPNKTLFTVHQIPKRGREGTREVWEVTDYDIANVYKGLARTLDEFFRARLLGFPHPSAHGYIRGRSTLTNARAHLGARLILNADIKSFFRSIRRRRIEELFKELGLGDDAARILTRVVSRANHLPLGLPTSPVLANAVCHQLDSALSALVPGGRYTRYADDLAFSGPVLPTKADVRHQLRAAGFKLADAKWRAGRAGRGLYVTGLSLEDAHKPHVPRTMKRRLRQELYYAKRFGVESHIGVRGAMSVQSWLNHCDGLIKYIRGVERDVGLAFQASFQEVLARGSAQVSYAQQNSAPSRKVFFFLDESEIRTQSVRRLAISLVVVEETVVVRNALSSALSDLAADPYGVTEKATLKKKGIHWNELSQDDRTTLTQVVRRLPVRAFIAYVTLPEGRAGYNHAYLQLLDVLLTARFVRYGGRDVEIVFEQNPRIKPAEVTTTANRAYVRLEQAKSRRPSSMPVVRESPKLGDAALPLPDLVLGIFGDYASFKLRAIEDLGAKKKRKGGELAVQRYARLRDKVRAIYDLDSGAVYSRRNPFRAWEPEATSEGGSGVHESTAD